VEVANDNFLWERRERESRFVRFPVSARLSFWYDCSGSGVLPVEGCNLPVGSHPSIYFRTKENQEDLDADGRSNYLTRAHSILASEFGKQNNYMIVLTASLT
jgi:hypothetical protein